MSERNAFLKLLEENEDDTATRLVYADWLDERGEYDEADRQRKWPAARQWLLRLCEESTNPDTGHSPLTYEELIAFGQRVATDESCSAVYLDDLAMEGIIRGHFQEFFQNWSVVTGIPLPAHLEKTSFYWECCPIETYWIGGAPPPRDADEPEEHSGEWDKWDSVQDDLTDSNPRQRKKRKQ